MTRLSSRKQGWFTLMHDNLAYHHLLEDELVVKALEHLKEQLPSMTDKQCHAVWLLVFNSLASLTHERLKEDED